MEKKTFDKLSTPCVICKTVDKKGNDFYYIQVQLFQYEGTIMLDNAERILAGIEYERLADSSKKKGV